MNILKSITELEINENNDMMRTQNTINTRGCGKLVEDNFEQNDINEIINDFKI